MCLQQQPLISNPRKLNQIMRIQVGCMFVCLFDFFFSYLELKICCVHIFCQGLLSSSGSVNFSCSKFRAKSLKILLCEFIQQNNLIGWLFFNISLRIIYTICFEVNRNWTFYPLFLTISGDEWKVWVTTKPEPGSGTKSAAVLILYGDKGQSKPVIIGESEDFEFKDGSTEQCDVRLVFVLKMLVQ